MWTREQPPWAAIVHAIGEAATNPSWRDGDRVFAGYSVSSGYDVYNVYTHGCFYLPLDARPPMGPTPMCLCHGIGRTYSRLSAFAGPACRFWPVFRIPMLPTWCRAELTLASWILIAILTLDWL